VADFAEVFPKRTHASRFLYLSVTSTPALDLSTSWYGFSASFPLTVQLCFANSVRVCWSCPDIITECCFTEWRALVHAVILPKSAHSQLAHNNIPYLFTKNFFFCQKSRLPQTGTTTALGGYIMHGHWPMSVSWFPEISWEVFGGIIPKF
jgi:hypothetical protein